MNIDVNPKGSGENLESSFRQGTIVFKATACVAEGEFKDVGMVITKEDYEKKLYTHKYNPILFLVDLPLRLSYLYGCLNVSFGQSREEDFVFWWRKIGENEWREWFTVKRYRDSIYGEKPELLM